ncbi:MAG: ferritin-like domain-containing protein [Candidatus Promineifilaceae bacterium]
MQLNTLHDVFLHQLTDLHSAEKQLIEALPKMAQAATDRELHAAFTDHLERTRSHADRLQTILRNLGDNAPAHKCVGMEGLIREGDEIIRMQGQPAAKDAALIGAAQRVEHYEIAGYGTAASMAKEMGHSDAADLLNQTLDEESQANEKLTDLAEGGLSGEGINLEANEGERGRMPSR